MQTGNVQATVIAPELAKTAVSQGFVSLLDMAKLNIPFQATGMVTTELTKAFSISVANLEPPPHPQTEVIERFVDPPTAPKTRRLSLGASLLLVGIIAALLGIFELQRPVPPAPATPVARTTPVATEGDRAPTSSPRAALPEPADRVVTSPTEPAPPVEPVRATRKAHATPLVFEARTLVRGGGQQRERKSRVVLGDDAEGATDGSHPNDLGFMRQAAVFEPILREALGR